MKDDFRDPHKLQVAMKYVKKTAVDVKSEERRRVLQ